MTTINTSSINLFNKFLTYFDNEHFHFDINHTPTNHSITLFNLTPSQTQRLLTRFTQHFHLTPALPVVPKRRSTLQETLSIAA